MPTIEFSLKDLNHIVGKELKIDEVEKLSEFAKAELESYSKETDTVTLSCGDTNLPYLWSVEGIARLFKGILNIEHGIPNLSIAKSDDKIIADKSISKIRPYIAAFSVKGKKIDDYTLKQIIQLQEKLCEGYGRKRKKLAIGIYPYKKIKFPVTYKSILPDGIRFIPLGMSEQMTPAEILQHHPIGQKYALVVEEFREFPILMDSDKKVLSFPPIINSAELGKIEIGDDNLFVELTGTDMDALHLGCNILAFALADRGFEISEIKVEYPDREIATPFLKTEKIKIKKENIKSLLGIELPDATVKKFLEQARFNFNNYEIEIPPFRQDILHPVDVIEDIGIMYGYDNIPTSPIASHTVGDVNPLVHFADKIREIIAGLGFVEILSPMLTNKELLYKKMNTVDFGTIEIKEYMSESYSVVRTWILPFLMEVLSKNKHHEYPQKIFESGLVTLRKKDKIFDSERIAAVYCGADADYTKVRQIVDLILNSISVEYTVEESVHSSFIPGRVARINVRGKSIAFVGEIHPEVLANFDVQMPASGFELNLSELYELKKKV